MKSFKFPVFVLAMGVAILSAFAANVKPSETANGLTRYYYSPSASQHIDDLSDPLNWSASGSSCNPSGTDVCTIDFNGNQAAFNAYISGFALQTKADVMAVASTKKN